MRPEGYLIYNEYLYKVRSDREFPEGRKYIIGDLPCPFILPSEIQGDGDGIDSSYSILLF